MMCDIHELAKSLQALSQHAPMPLQVKDEPLRSAGVDDRSILPLPWDIIAPHAQRAFLNHGQSLEPLASRGGLSPCEAVAILEDRPWHRMDQTAAIERLAELVRAATDRVPS